MCFKFLTVDDNDNIVLRQTSDYHFQMQGKLYISQRHYCYFVVFTFKDFFLQKIEFDRKYCRDHCCQNWISFAQITSDPICPLHFNL